MRTKLVILTVAAASALLAIRVGIDARAQAPFTHDFGPDVEQPPRRSMAAQPTPKGPMSARAAKTWERLAKDTNFRFADETPFEEVLKYIKAASATEGADDPGLPIYVDPVGLQEAEKTMTAPITIDLDDVPIKSGLELLLKQLGLRFFVRDDGILVITSENYDQSLTEPDPDIAQALRELKDEIAALRKDLRSGEPAKAFGKKPDISAEIGELRNVILEMRDARRAGP
jgi:hypothetical protein